MTEEERLRFLIEKVAGRHLTAAGRQVLNRIVRRLRESSVELSYGPKKLDTAGLTAAGLPAVCIEWRWSGQSFVHTLALDDMNFEPGQTLWICATETAELSLTVPGLASPLFSSRIPLSPGSILSGDSLRELKAAKWRFDSEWERLFEKAAGLFDEWGRQQV